MQWLFVFQIGSTGPAPSSCCYWSYSPHCSGCGGPKAT